MCKHFVRPQFMFHFFLLLVDFCLLLCRINIEKFKRRKRRRRKNAQTKKNRTNCTQSDFSWCFLLVAHTFIYSELVWVSVYQCNAMLVCVWATSMILRHLFYENKKEKKIRTKSMYFQSIERSSVGRWINSRFVYSASDEAMVLIRVFIR